MPSAPSGYTFRHIRDPLYGFVGISEEEDKLINTKAFLRLQWVKQLSHAHLVCPSATHTRYEHSLGVLHVAGRMCDALSLKRDQKRLVRLAALLHDICHGPFSHLFEEAVRKANKPGVTHETISVKIIREDEECRGVLGEDAEAVADLLAPSKKRPLGERRSCPI